MATLDFGGDDGVGNGTTPVTLVAAPGSGVRRIVKTITIKSNDTAQKVATIRKVSAGGTREVFEVTLDPGDNAIFNEAIVLDATTDSVTLVMSAAATTTEPDWSSSWADWTP